MKILYLPLYRMAVSYVVSFGRRWSVLEHLLLVDVASSRRTTGELAALTGMPDRLVIEALIRLMRHSWVEVRTTDAGVYFAATAAGRRRATEENLPVTLQRDVKWLSVCVDRLTGAWLRADELDLVYERDLPENCTLIDPRIHTYDRNDASLRDLFPLNMDESLEPTTPQIRTPSKPYARVCVAFGKIEAGLPSHAALRLKEAAIAAAATAADTQSVISSQAAPTAVAPLRDDIGEEDIIVGGPEHLTLLKAALEAAKSTIVIHSCFLSPDTIRMLLPEFERAARRKVRIELLWGLYIDPEEPTKRKPISDTEKALDELPSGIRGRVQLSPISSGSHAKIIVYDDTATGKWISIVSSCNFLSTGFDWVEASVRSRAQRLAARLLGRLIAAQLPASGSWSPVARRLNQVWSQVRHKAGSEQDIGLHTLTLLTDQDHYACVTLARDVAEKEITIGCDLYGLAAETSVLVPMTTASESNRKVSLIYNRPSKLLREEGRVPDAEAIGRRGINLSSIQEFHAKFLSWDEEALAITSFNWMSTVVDGTRARGAEIGVLIEGKDLKRIFATKLGRATNGKFAIPPTEQKLAEQTP